MKRGMAGSHPDLADSLSLLAGLPQVKVSKPPSVFVPKSPWLSLLSSGFASEPEE